MLDSHNQSSTVGEGGLVMGKGGRRRNVDGEREVADNLHFLEENALSRRKYSGVGKIRQHCQLQHFLH